MKSLSRQLMRAWLGQSEILSNISSPSLLKPSWPRSASTKPLVLKYFTKKVEPFGKIIVNVPCNVEIKPTDPHEYSNTSTMIVNIKSTNKLSKDDLNNDSIKVNINSDICEIQAGEDEKIPQGIYCLIQAPPRYDVEVKTTEEGNVDVSGMVSDSITIQTEFGNITGSKLQGQTISFSSSEGGSIKLENNVQGNIEINTAKDGSIDAEKCMGTKLDVSTEDGDVIIGSNYCEMATFTTANGHLNLNNLHMDSTIDISGAGTLNISCLDGSLQANLGDGDASVQIARITGDSEIKTSGCVTLKVPETCETQLKLEAEKLDIDEKISGKYLDDKNTFISGKNGFKFNVKTDKSVIVKQSSWMDCLKSQKNVA